MRYFVGIDVGHRMTSVSVINEKGERVRDEAVVTEPKAIVAVIKPYKRSCVRVGIESCSVANWLAPELARLRLPIVCIEARHAHSVLKASINKTDRNDARGIANLVRTGVYRVVHLKSPESRYLGTLITIRRTVLAKVMDVENAIGGILRSFGLKPPRSLTQKYDEQVRAELAKDKELEVILEPLITLRKLLRDEFKRVDDDLKAAALKDPICKRLMTAPGVGPIVAATFRAVIDVPERFRRSQTVGAHLGLTPRTRQSGQYERRGKISKFGDAEMRRLLYLAGWAVLNTRAQPHPLREWGEAIAARSGRNRAIIAIARRLAVILHRMWADGTDYEPRPAMI